MEKLLKNVTETDIINFDFIKRNNLTLSTGTCENVNRLFSSRLSFDILSSAHSRLRRDHRIEFDYVNILDMSPEDALYYYRRNTKYHIFNNPLYRYFNYDKILEYANNHPRINSFLDKFEEENIIGRSVSIFSVSKKTFDERYNLELTLEIQNTLIEEILTNENVTINDLLKMIRRFTSENNLIPTKNKSNSLQKLIESVKAFPMVYEDLDGFVKKYHSLNYDDKAGYVYKLTGFKNIHDAKAALPFFPLRLALLVDRKKKCKF